MTTLIAVLYHIVIYCVPLYVQRCYIYIYITGLIELLNSLYSDKCHIGRKRFFFTKHPVGAMQRILQVHPYISQGASGIWQEPSHLPNYNCTVAY